VVTTAHQVRSYVASVSTEHRPSRPPTGTSAAEHTNTQQYEVRVRGHLGSRWRAWFDGLSISTEDDGITVIRGPVVDQAALHGLLQKLRDVGIPLVSLTELPPDAPTTEGPAPEHEGR
jgi:hypothetical protein